ncbi:hypothetical protein HYC85_026811 [Camellia sinensis]|uniref:Uncharacterized protein n=1 Tax=Camellia sinensis TaxID=4442 RepID=A0A7J7G4L6_CAMSI|nr:hypothetical protein HYC85_026811 [Camellia sinensis]
MIANGIEDEDKWLTEGIARIQHNCFLYASRTDHKATQILESRICEPEIAVSSVKSAGSGQIKLKEAALETSANSLLEKEKDLEDKIEELERRLEELSQNSASFYEYQFQKREANFAKLLQIRSSSINAEYEAKACDTQAAVKVDQHTSTTPKLKIIAVLSLASIEEMRMPAVGDLMANFTGPNLGCTESKIQQHQQGLCLGASPNNRTLFAYVNCRRWMKAFIDDYVRR